MKPANTPIRDWRGRRVWLIGASSGIGAALAQALLAAGAEVAVSARRIETLHAVVGEQKNGLAIALDANDSSSWHGAAAELRARWPELDLVVFCQGDYQALRADNYDVAVALHLLDINLLSLYRGLDVVLPWLRNQGRGGIAITASVAAYRMLPQAMAYGAAKAAAVYLAESLYFDLAPQGYSVYCINPGFVATRLTAKNEFVMPTLLSPEQAAAAIMRGFARGQFEIHFPKRFTYCVKLMCHLPFRLHQWLLHKVTGL